MDQSKSHYQIKPCPDSQMQNYINQFRLTDEEFSGYLWKFTTCSKVIDPKTFDTIVVIGCFYTEGAAVEPKGLLLWNTATNKLSVILFSFFKTISQYEITIENNIQNRNPASTWTVIIALNSNQRMTRLPRWSKSATSG